jgi:hypothetical protein
LEHLVATIERLEAKMDAWLEEMKACLEKTDCRIKANQEEVRVEIRTDLEEMKATESEAIVEHCERVPHAEATHLAALQDYASVLHEVPKGVTYEENIGALDRFGDRNLGVGYRNQMKTWSQGNSESLQEISTAGEQMTHHAFPALHEDHIHRGTGKAFIDSIREQSMKQQLLLGRKRTVNPQADRRAGSCKVGSYVFHQAGETSDRAQC